MTLMTPLQYNRVGGRDAAAMYFDHKHETPEFWRGYLFAMKEMELHLLKHQENNCQGVCTCEDTNARKHIDTACNHCFIGKLRPFIKKVRS